MMDPAPIVFDGDFTAAAKVLRQKLSANNEPRLNDISRRQQVGYLRAAIDRDCYLLALLEDPEWQRSIRLAAAPEAEDPHVAVTPNEAKHIKPGDVLNVSYYMLPHKVVATSCNYDESTRILSFCGIHYGRLSLMHPITAMRESFKVLCDGSSLWLHPFPKSVLYTAEETLARAVSRLGDQQQHPTNNNAAALAFWCRVRDQQRNRDNIQVPLFDNSGTAIHALKPADHVSIAFTSRRIQAVLTEVESFDENTDWKLLSMVARTEDLASLTDKERRAFTGKTLPLLPDQRLALLQVEFSVEEVRRNALKYCGISLLCDCTELQAIAFLGTGKCKEPSSFARCTIDVSEVRAGHLISHSQGIHFVLAVSRPVGPDQTYSIETVQYAPLGLRDAPKTSQLRLWANLSGNQSIHLIRYSEPDIQSPILTCWKFNDSPLVNEQHVERLADLLPGDPVCIRQSTAAYPLAARMPGLHAVVKSIELSAESGRDEVSSVEVICYTSGVIPTVGIRRVTAKDHTFSRLVFEVSQETVASREEALRMAIARLGTDQYCCSWSNSRDLVRWCCVNHKANSSHYLRQLRSIEDVLNMTSIGQRLLRLQHVDVTGDSTVLRLRDVRVNAAKQLEDCLTVLKLTVSGATWTPKCVSIVKTVIFPETGIYRIHYNGTGSSRSVDPAATQLRSDAMSALLGASLVDASDNLLGANVTDKDFCEWVRRLSRPGLSELPILLSTSARRRAADSSDYIEVVSDRRSLNIFDHVVVDRPGAAPLHLLVIEFDAELNTLCGYTYCPLVNESSENHLDLFMHFPAESAPYPMHTVISRSQAGSDSSSQLSSRLSAVSNFPHDAASWAQMAVLELESDLLLEADLLNLTLKSMLKFAFRVASDSFRKDGSLEACVKFLASDELRRALIKTSEHLPEEKGRRMYFIVRLIAALIRAVD